MSSAITLAGLVKRFGSFPALDGLDLDVSAGEVRLLGGDPWRNAVELHRRLAYVPGDVSLWPKLSGGEVIDLFGRLRGDLEGRRREELLDRFELDPTKRARTYSKGNRQKVALVAALASSAELLILAIVGSGFAVQATQWLRSEEAALRLEPLLAAPVSRHRWMASHLGVAFAGSAVVLAAGGFGVGLAYAFRHQGRGRVSTAGGRCPRLPARHLGPRRGRGGALWTRAPRSHPSSTPRWSPPRPSPPHRS